MGSKLIFAFLHIGLSLNLKANNNNFKEMKWKVLLKYWILPCLKDGFYLSQDCSGRWSPSVLPAYGIKYFYTKDKIPSGNQKYIENAIFGLNNKDFPIIMFQTDSGSNITEQEFIDVMDSVIVK